jgi:LacI family transcriptional regulator
MKIQSASKTHRPLTITEFADAIGVSPTTVSRSMTRRGRISDETREMVLKRMEELGYTPNLHAQRLVSGRARTVALCMGERLAPTSDLFLVELIRGLQQALQEYDYALLLLGQGEGLKRWVDSRAVDGIIVVGDSPEDAAVARTVVRPSVPCVMILTMPRKLEPNIGSVIINLASGGVKVARALVEKGHRRIGFIGSHYSKSVLPAFRRELERLRTPMRPEWAIIAGDALEDGERAMHRLLTLPTPPTAVFTRTDELAIGALRAARKLRVSVPDQVSVIGHDDLTFARFVEPPLSSVHVDFDEVGKAVVAQLFDLLEDPDTSLVTRSVETHIIMRETVDIPNPSCLKTGDKGHTQ